jgi:DNA-binding Lrp family transcriptional regulator
MTRAVDVIDRQILALLRENARRTFLDIGGHVALSVAAVKRRVDRLEADGVIRGYSAVLDEAKLGGAIEVMVEVYAADRTAPGDMRDMLEGIDEVVTAFTVSGEPDAIVRLRVEDIAHLERAVERLRRDPNVVRTRTMIVLSTVIDRASGLGSR